MDWQFEIELTISFLLSIGYSQARYQQKRQFLYFYTYPNLKINIFKSWAEIGIFEADNVPTRSKNLTASLTCSICKTELCMAN
jgi:hypothetical protein